MLVYEDVRVLKESLGDQRAQKATAPDPARSNAAAEARPTLDGGERVRLLRDGILNSGALIVSGAMGIVLVPIMLHGLGAKSYGLWVYALSSAALAGLVDPGLGWSLTHEVARAELPPDNEHDETVADDAAQLISSIAIAYLIIGCIGALLIYLLGFVLVPGLNLSPANRTTAEAVFWFVCVSFLGNTMLGFSTSVLHGVRRFGIASAITITDNLLTVGGMIVLIVGGSSLISVATWYGLISLSTGLITIGLVARLEPRYRIRPLRFSLRSIWPQMKFGIKSQLAGGMGRAGWDFMPLLVGMFAGPAPVAIYDVGQKFPRFLRGVGALLCQPIFPSASSYTEETRSKAGRVIVEAGLRNVVLILGSLFLGIGILAPALLNLWLGKVSVEAVWVLRLTLLAAWLDCVAAAPFEFQWGLGTLDEILVVLGTAAVVNLTLSSLLIVRLGVAGAALGTAFADGIACAAIVILASRTVGAEWSALFRDAWRGFGIPVAACAVVLVSMQHFVQASRADEFILICVTAASAYYVPWLVHGSRDEERAFLELLVAARPRNLVRAIYRIVCGR